MTTVTIYINHQTKTFSISKRADHAVATLEAMAKKEASRGYIAANVGEDMTDNDAVVLRGNLFHAMEVAGYEAVTREALEKGAVYA